MEKWGHKFEGKIRKNEQKFEGKNIETIEKNFLGIKGKRREQTEETKDLMQKWPYMPHSYTHEVNILYISFDHTFQKSIVRGFLKCNLHRCEWCITHVVSTVDNWTEKGFIWSKYRISILIFYLSIISYYLFIQSISNPPTVTPLQRGGGTYGHFCIRSKVWHCQIPCSAFREIV